MSCLSEALTDEVYIWTVVVALAGGEPHVPAQPHMNESSDSEPFAQFADLGQSSSDEDEVMAPYGG